MKDGRLMCVGMTRVRDFLHVSATNPKKPSVFAYEAGLIKKVNVMF